MTGSCTPPVGGKDRREVLADRNDSRAANVWRYTQGGQIPRPPDLHVTAPSGILIRPSLTAGVELRPGDSLSTSPHRDPLQIDFTWARVFPSSFLQLAHEFQPAMMVTARILTLTTVPFAILVASRWTPARILERASFALRSTWTPLFAGGVTSLLIAWMWGSLRAIAVYHDGVAYLTQARIFSRFHLYAPARPLPEFFEQYHMFVTPVFMAKYPPGHSLLLVPGLWLGLPALMPVLLAGVTGGFTFALARRITNEWIALTTWLLWATAPGVIWYTTTYLSQTTTSALWLVGWWALFVWCKTGRRRWLLLLGGSIGWGLLTHPYTWALYAIPVAVVVLRRLARLHTWHELVMIACVGCGFVALLFGWSDRTVGAGFQLPWSIYARTYMPWDRIGFGVDTAKPQRVLPPDMIHFVAQQRAFRAKHTVKTLPAQLLARTTSFVVGVWGDWRIVLLPFVLFSFMFMFPEFAFGLISAALVILGFLLYAHDPRWQAYYLELFPIFAFAIAVGLWRPLCLIFKAAHSFPVGRPSEQSSRPATAMLVICVLILPFCFFALLPTREAVAARRYRLQAFQTAVSSLAGEHTMVFVRYSALDTSQLSFISNDASVDATKAWIVHDRDADDIRLIRVAPTRIPYLYDEATNTFRQIDTNAVAAAARARQSIVRIARQRRMVPAPF